MITSLLWILKTKKSRRNKKMIKVKSLMRRTTIPNNRILSNKITPTKSNPKVKSKNSKMKMAMHKIRI